MKSNTIVLLTNAAMTGTTTVESAPIPLEQIFGYAVQAVWTGTPNGSLKLQASCDAPGRDNQTSNGGPDDVTNWTDIAGSTLAITGVAGNYMYNVTDAFYRYFRVVYTNTSGVGSLSVKAVVKGV
jgi:hypothetical protein